MNKKKTKKKKTNGQLSIIFAVYIFYNKVI